MEFRIYDKWKKKYCEAEKCAMSATGEILILSHGEKPGTFFGQVNLIPDRFVLERYIGKKGDMSKHCFVNDVIKYDGKDWFVYEKGETREFYLKECLGSYHYTIPDKFEIVNNKWDYLKAKG